MDIKGYAGKILRIDLSTGKIEKQPTPIDLMKKYIGGRGLSSYILWKEVKHNIKPFDDDNLLIFATGPLNGTPLPSSGRLTIASKSPLTGILGDANSGGSWSPELKWAGYDAIVIKGKSNKPVYIWIDDDNVSIKDASHIWGKTVDKAYDIIREELNDEDIRIAAIGPAGENNVRYANVVVDGYGANGRCGMGAVMGSKMLKAIAVRGTKDINIAEPETFAKLLDEYVDDIINEDWAKSLTLYGTSNLVVHRQTLGLWGARNFQDDLLDNWENVGPEKLNKEHVVRVIGCMGCLVRCKRMAKAKFHDNECYTKLPEYDVINALSAKTLVTDSNALIYASHLCDELGLDAQTAGSTIAMAMELYERGILTKDQTDGLEFNFGDPEVMMEAIQRIAYRKGVGDLLADGTKVLGENFKAEYYAPHIKGLEIDATDPRRFVTRALSYAVSTRGSCHLRSYPYVDEFITKEEAEEWFGESEVSNAASIVGKGKMIAWTENWVALADMLGICKFAWYRSRRFKKLIERGINLTAKLYKAATGIEINDTDFLKCGERVYNIERLFNYNNGIRRKDDVPPDRFFVETLKRGPGKGIKLDKAEYEKLLDEYYDAHGWDKEGRPTKEKMEELQVE